MTNKGIRSKRRWIQWLSYAATALGPTAVILFPQYTVPITGGIAAVNGINGLLAQLSKNKSEKLDADAKAEGTTQEVEIEDGSC